MASVNKVILLGNLGRDPELRYTQSGGAVATLSIATTERWTSKEGERKEKTEWHRVVLWGRQAEVANQYLKKGSSCYIEGRITTREWEDKDKQKRYTTEIVGQTLQLMPRSDGGGGGSRGSNEPPPPSDEYYDSFSGNNYDSAGAASSSSSNDSAPSSSSSSPDDDLPF